MHSYMFQGGVLVAVVHGCKGPDLEKLIKEKLEHEHKCLNGEAERVAVSGEGQITEYCLLLVPSVPLPPSLPLSLC